MQRRVLRYSVVNFALAGRQNLNPLTLGVGDEIKAHARVLANNATHLFVKLVDGVKVVHNEGDMGALPSFSQGSTRPRFQVSSIPKGTPSLPMNVLVHEPSHESTKTQSPIKRKEREGRQPELMGQAKTTLAKCARRPLKHRHKCPLLFQRGQNDRNPPYTRILIFSPFDSKKTIVTEVPVSQKQLFCYHFYVLYA